jgi:mannose-6-phosphate isomerase-like protein (cupin superfamily)
MEDQSDDLLLFAGRHYSLGRLNSGLTGSRVLSDVDFATPWELFDLVELDAAQVWALAGGSSVEEGIVLLDGTVEIETGEIETGEIELEGEISTVAAPATVLFPVGRSSSLRTVGSGAARFLHVQVGLKPTDQARRALQVEAVDVARLKWRDAIHGGSGRIATRHIWGPADFSSSWTFMDHAVLGPQGSVGYHYHDALEECFVVLSGRGYMSIDDQTFAVGPRSVTWQGIGEAHGIYNLYDEPLDFLRIAVAQPDEQYTTIDLHDDLTGRRPDGQKD